MRMSTKQRGRPPLGLTSLAGSAALVAVSALTVALLAGDSGAATNVAPQNTGGAVDHRHDSRRPGTEDDERHVDRHRSDRLRLPLVPMRRSRQAGRVGLHADRERQERAATALREADAGFRIRSQVVATNDDGPDTATSNATTVVTSAKPFNTTEPSISGTARVGQHPQGQPWPVGRRHSDHLLVRVASLQRQGRQLQRDPGRERPRVRDPRQRHRPDDPRPRHREERPWLDVCDLEPDRCRRLEPAAAGSSLAVGDLKAAGDRLVVASVQFSPNPVTSRTAPITVRVRVTARGGRPVNGALVFMRGTPTGRDGSDPGNAGRRLRDAHAGSERAVPAAAERLQRAVLRQGVPEGRPGARRHRRLPARAGPPGRVGNSDHRESDRGGGSLAASSSVVGGHTTLERRPAEPEVHRFAGCS